MNFLQKIEETKVTYQLNLDQTYPQEILTEIPIKQSTENLERKRESVSQTVESKHEQPSTPIYIKKRKSPGIFSCFRSKKAKTSSEQHGQPTVEPTTAVAVEPQTTSPTTEEKPVATDLAVLPDGRRLYIDSYRERPGLDMSYKPDDFDNRFVLPVVRISEMPIYISNIVASSCMNSFFRLLIDAFSFEIVFPLYVCVCIASYFCQLEIDG